MNYLSLFFNLRVAAAFIEEFTSVFFVLTLLGNSRKKLSLFHSELSAFSLQHLSFLPHLLRVAATANKLLFGPSYT
jgi:hypothetical protein